MNPSLFRLAAIAIPMTIELYEFPGCHYCTEVKRKLAELDLDYVSHTVPRAHLERTSVKAVSDQSAVPVLVDTDHGIDGLPESNDIIAYLERTYGKSGTEA